MVILTFYITFRKVHTAPIPLHMASQHFAMNTKTIHDPLLCYPFMFIWHPIPFMWHANIMTLSLCIQCRIHVRMTYIPLHMESKHVMTTKPISMHIHTSSKHVWMTIYSSIWYRLYMVMICHIICHSLIHLDLK